MRRRPLTGAGSIVQSVRSAQGAEVVRRHGKQRPSFRSECEGRSSFQNPDFIASPCFCEYPVL